MVRLCYQDVANSYLEVKQAACGRQACSVMIMVAYEVDAISSCKMLTQLLRSDNIAYTIRPVLNLDEVVHTFNTFVTEDIKSIFMINCGAVYNIPKLFDLERGGDIRVFILDNHRPYHLANIYSRHSVVVFDDTYDPNSYEEDDQMSIPSDGSDISGGNSSSSNSDSSSEEDGDEEEMYDEELQENDDINAAFDQNDEEAELEDDDHNSQAEEEGDEEAEEAENEEVVEEEGEDIRSDEERSADEEAEGEGSEGVQEEEDEVDGSEGEGPAATSSSGKRKKAQQIESIEDEEGAEEGDEAEEEEGEEENYSSVKRPRTTTGSGTVSGRQGDAEEEEEEEEIQVRGRRRKESELVVRARERKHQLQNYYSQNTSYTAPTAVMMVGLLSDQLGSTRLPVEVLWQAVLGVTYQYSAGHIPESLYTEYCSFLKTQFGDALRTGNERTQYAVKAGVEESNPPVVSVGSTAALSSSSEEGDLLMVPGSETGQVEEASEYRFFLHRHWSLYDAMYHSPYVASKLNVWSQQGTLKLQELLARMGMPLQQCRQSYQFMTPSLRSHFAGQMQDESILEAYNLINPGVAFKSFYRFNSFRNPVAALDLVHAATALTELYGVAAYSTTLTTTASTNSINNETINETTTANIGSDGSNNTAVITQSASNTHKVSSIDAFYDAYYCLGMRSDALLQKGVQAALDLQRTIVKKAAVMLDGNSTIHRSHRLYYAYLSHNTSSWGPSTTTAAVSSSSSGKPAAVGDSAGAPIEHTFGRPMVLAKLGQYIMDIKRNLPKKNGGWTGSALLPFILLSEKQDGTFVVVGISPFANLSGGEEITEEQSSKLYPLTNFRQFFKLAGQLLGATIRNITFDANVVEVRREDVQEFLGALDDSLRKATPRHNSSTTTATTTATTASDQG